MTNELAVVEHVNGTSLEAYQDRNEVRELTERLLSLHPAASEVGRAGMIAVAQLALLVGASPLPGTNEIHVWKSGSKVQFQLGINFYRRKAEERGGVLWDTQPRQMREDEREEYGVPKGVLAAICKAVKAKDMEKYHAMGFPANRVWEMCTRVGIGTANTSEGKAGRTPIWTAFKRAEVDMYRSLFPTMMAEIEQTRQQNVTITGPEWKEFTGDEIDDMFSHGDTPEDQTVYEVDAETGEFVEIDDFDQEAPEDQQQEGQPKPKPVADEVHHDPDFWLDNAVKSKDIDGLAMALFKLHEQSGVVGNAQEMKGTIIRICGKSPDSGRAVAAIGKYINAVADGTAKATAVKAAEDCYLKEAA